MDISHHHHALLLWAVVACAQLSGCGSTAPIQIASRVLDVALQATGINSGVNAAKKAADIPIKIVAGTQLNTAQDGRPLSMVMKVYSLRSTERLKSLTYEQLSTSEREKEGLGDDLLYVQELVLLPGQSYTLSAKHPENTTAIGVVGLFRSPYAQRWKLAFEIPRTTTTPEIIVGAHACALTTSSTTAIPEPRLESAENLAGVKCHL